MATSIKQNIIEIIILPIQYYVYTNLGLAVLDGHTLSPWTLAWVIFDLVVSINRLKKKKKPTTFSVMLTLIIVITAIIAAYPVFFLDNRNPIFVSTLSFALIGMIYGLILSFFKEKNKDQNEYEFFTKIISQEL